ncbi:hypothetical protein ACFE04_008038 [Oxalis oulophora]
MGLIQLRRSNHVVVNVNVNVNVIILSVLLLNIISGQVSAQAQPSPDPQYNYAEFNPSMAIIIVVLIAAFFFMGFFSVYIRYCSESSNGNSIRPLTHARSCHATARGLDPEVILTFPTFPYSDVKELKIGKGALECAVCLNEFEDDETLRLIPKCDHVFHPECIDEWLSLHTTCPVCRANLVPGLTDDDSSPPQVADELTHDSTAAASDVEAAQVERCEEVSVTVDVEAPAPEVISVNQSLNRNRTRGSRSGRPRRFPRSHSTGHSLVQPGENTDRFTLRLPVEVRNQIMNKKLNRASSMVLTTLPREGSSRQGYRIGGVIRSGSSRAGRSLRWLGRSDRWTFNIPPIFSRAGSVRSLKATAKDGESSSVRSIKGANSFGDSSRPPV